MPSALSSRLYWIAYTPNYQANARSMQLFGSGWRAESKGLCFQQWILLRPEWATSHSVACIGFQPVFCSHPATPSRLSEVDQQARGSLRIAWPSLDNLLAGCAELESRRDSRDAINKRRLSYFCCASQLSKTNSLSSRLTSEQFLLGDNGRSFISLAFKGWRICG